MRDESDNPTTQMSGQDDTFHTPFNAFITFDSYSLNSLSRNHDDLSLMHGGATVRRLDNNGSLIQVRAVTNKRISVITNVVDI